MFPRSGRARGTRPRSVLPIRSVSTVNGQKFCHRSVLPPPAPPTPPRGRPSPPDRPDTDPVVGGSLTRFPRSPCGGDTCRDAETTRRTRRRESRVLSDAGEKSNPKRGQLVRRMPNATTDANAPSPRFSPSLFPSPLFFFSKIVPFSRDRRSRKLTIYFTYCIHRI